MDFQLRKWEETDAKYLAEALSNPRVLDNLRDGLPYPYTEADALWYIREMQKAAGSDAFPFAVVSDGKAIGSISVFRQDNVHRLSGELGYYLGEQYWGNGVMTEAVRQICREVFQQSNIVRIFAMPFAQNIASCRVLEKAGFQFEGLLRQHAVKNGKLLDVKMYALLRSDLAE